MDGLLDRFERMLRSFLSPDSGQAAAPGGDPDFQEAWRELDEYLQSGVSPRPRYEPGGGDRGAHTETDEGLRRDYANLEVHFGAPLAEVKRAYKSLLKRYHPDKFATDPEKQRLATEITLRINRSYRNIRDTLQARP